MKEREAFTVNENPGRSSNPQNLATMVLFTHRLCIDITNVFLLLCSTLGPGTYAQDKVKTVKTVKDMASNAFVTKVSCLSATAEVNTSVT